MIKRTLYFGNEAYLSTKVEQLVVNFPDKEKPPAKVPIEDIGVVILDHYWLTYSQSLVTKLLYNNIALVTCNEQHLPQGLKECYFIYNHIASHVMQSDAKSNYKSKGEFGSQNKFEKIDGYDDRIKDICWKLEVNRLGKFTKVIR